MTNFQAYHGDSLVETYRDESTLEGFGLYINRELIDDVVNFKIVPFNEKYDYVLLCQSFVNLCKDVKQLPIQINMLHDTDTYFRIEEDLRFFREIRYIKKYHPSDKIREKYQKVYDIYKANTENLFERLEEKDFMPFALNECFMGSSNPFELLAEKELVEPKPG